MENNIVSLAYIIKDTAQSPVVRCLLPLCDTIVVSIYNIFFYWKFARLSFTSALSSISEIA